MNTFNLKINFSNLVEKKLTLNWVSMVFTYIVLNASENKQHNQFDICSSTGLHFRWDCIYEAICF